MGLVHDQAIGLSTNGVGCVYLISMYYKRYELQWRFTLFFTASIIAVSRWSLTDMF
jgi:hypothetical protein